MPWTAFVFLMGHLSVNQIYRQFVHDNSIVDITGMSGSAKEYIWKLTVYTGVQMVMVMKVRTECTFGISAFAKDVLNSSPLFAGTLKTDVSL